MWKIVKITLLVAFLIVLVFFYMFITSDTIEDANIASTRLKVFHVLSELKSFEEKNKKLPNSLNELNLDNSWLKDDWGNTLIYRVQNGKFLLLSPGPDGKVNTNDDITNKLIDSNTSNNE